jgi:hypothetical protein
MMILSVDLDIVPRTGQIIEGGREIAALVGCEVHQSGLQCRHVDAELLGRLRDEARPRQHVREVLADEPAGRLLAHSRLLARLEPQRNRASLVVHQLVRDDATALLERHRALQSDRAGPEVDAPTAAAVDPLEPDVLAAASSCQGFHAERCMAGRLDRYHRQAAGLSSACASSYVKPSR